MARDIEHAGVIQTLPNEVPIFPLPDHVFLPSIQAPYRVFEPRYRALVDWLLDQPEDERWLAIPRLATGWQTDYHGAPPFNPVATVGRMLSCETLRGGHFYIVVEGVARCRLSERVASEPYRIANVEPLPDLALVGDQIEVLRTRMRAIGLHPRAGPRPGCLGLGGSGARSLRSRARPLSLGGWRSR